jgi:short-subunit dehydrogenase
MPEHASTGTKSRTSARDLALITGASAGLGAAFAHAYAARGVDVALVARRVERLEALAGSLTKAHGVEAIVIPADLAGFEAHEPVMAALAERGRHVDILVNNAGFGIAQSFAGVPWARQRDLLMTMVVTPCALARAVIPGMAHRQRGAIINISSLAAFSPGVAGHSLYPGVKSLLLKFSQALEAEYGRKGIRVTALCPGAVESEFGQVAGTDAIMGADRWRFTQTAESVVQIAIRANEAGRLVVVPGLRNKIAAVAMQALPEPLVRAILAAGSARYHLKDESSA